MNPIPSWRSRQSEAVISLSEIYSLYSRYFRQFSHQAEKDREPMELHAFVDWWVGLSEHDQEQYYARFRTDCDDERAARQEERVAVVRQYLQEET